jgi:3-isopropylmalate/(R)-2-methylmalate dehydratase small subunit
VTVNLEEQFVETEKNEKFEFDIDSGLKERLIKGLDDIGLTLDHADEIREYEKSREKVTPWLFKELSA